MTPWSFGPEIEFRDFLQIKNPRNFIIETLKVGMITAGNFFIGITLY